MANTDKEQKIKDGDIVMTENTDKSSVEENDTPVYMTHLDLTPDQISRLTKEVFDEFDELKKLKAEKKLDEKCDALDNQYAGVLAENPNCQFNLHKHSTKIVVDTIKRYIRKAFLDVDPIVSITPRPEYATEAGPDVCERKQDYIDYKIDEGGIPLKRPFSLLAHSVTLKGTSWIKITHRVRTTRKKRDETYKGTPIIVFQDQSGNIVEIDATKVDESKSSLKAAGFMPVGAKNEGLEEFLRVYPDTDKIAGYDGYVKKLSEGKEINIVVEYDDTTFNDPYPEFVDKKNFYYRLDCADENELGDELLLVERIPYTYWKLKREESRGIFQNVDDITLDKDKKTKLAKYRQKTYQILECTYHFKLNDDAKDETATKIVCWFDEESKKYLGAINYPYYGVECNYIPFNIMETEEGIEQEGVGAALTDTNIAEDALLNFVLEALWQRNMITPVIEEGSQIEEQLLEKTWTHGMPLVKKQGETVDFLQKYMQQIDVGGIVTLMNVIQRINEDATGPSAYTAGRESSIDPDAPAKKTIALLKQSGLHIEDYIATLVPSFNKLIDAIVQITYQIMKENRKYKPRSGKAVDGDNPFADISRADMIARTNIQSQAMNFNLDKANEKIEDLSLYQTVRNEPLISRNPDAVYVLLKNLIKGWSTKWRAHVDKILPAIDDLKQSQKAMAVQAVAQYVEAKAKEAQATGVKPPMDLEELAGIVNDAVSTQVNPTEEEMEAKGA